MTVLATRKQVSKTAHRRGASTSALETKKFPHQQSEPGVVHLLDTLWVKLERPAHISHRAPADHARTDA